MRVPRWSIVLALLALLSSQAGCPLVPVARYNGLKAESEALGEKNRALSAQLENVQTHARNVEDKLMRAEEDLALLKDQQEQDRRQLAGYRQQHDELVGQVEGIASGRFAMPAEVSGRLVELSRRYPSLHFDPRTGIAKLDTDILFDSGEVALKQGAEGVLGELAAILAAPEARDLRVMIVGHTDEQPIAGREVRQQYADNFHLSTARALAVAEQLRKLGLADERMGVAGFAAHQPVAPNASPQDRQKNRRVELFVFAPEVPVIGWTESIPTAYY